MAEVPSRFLVRQGQTENGTKFFADKIAGCDGANVPALSWKDQPGGTKSLTLTLYDPGCSNWQLLAALAGLEHPGDCYWLREG
jgi:hypothetical protein